MSDIPHLQHLIPWKDLADLNRTKHPSTVHLPIGKCGLIHARTKETSQKLERRRQYISDNQICIDKQCHEEDTYPGRFAKKERSNQPICLSRLVPKDVITKDDYRMLYHFCTKFSSTIQQFASQEEMKLDDHKLKKIVAGKVRTLCGDETAYREYKDGRLRLFLGEGYEKGCWVDDLREWSLIGTAETTEDLAILLELDKAGKLGIRDALNAYHGGQAVGNGTSFLLRHLLRFYISTNLILASGYSLEKSEWGSMETPIKFPSLIDWLLSDCDFFTFIPSWRSILKDDVLICDGNATMDVLRKCFRLFVVLEVLFRRHGFRRCKFDANSICNDIVRICNFEPKRNLIDSYMNC